MARTSTLIQCPKMVTLGTKMETPGTLGSPRLLSVPRYPPAIGRQRPQGWFRLSVYRLAALQLPDCGKDCGAIPKADYAVRSFLATR